MKSFSRLTDFNEIQAIVSEINVQNIQSHSYANFIKSSFDVGYFALIIPFRFRNSPDGMGGKTGYTIHKHLPQQILCGITHLLVLLIYFSEIRLFPHNKTVAQASPDDYLTSLQSIASFLHKLFLIKAFWLDQIKFQRIVDYLTQKNDLPYHYSKVQSKFFLVLFSTSLVIICLGFQIYGYGIISQTYEWSPALVYRNYVKTARFVFFFNSTNVPEMHEISSSDIGISVVTIIGYFFRRLFGYYSDNIFLMACLTLWVPIQGFKSLLSLQSPAMQMQTFETEASQYGHFHNIYLVLRKYSALKDLAYLINDAMGVSILMYSLDCIGFYATDFAVVIITSDWLMRFYDGLYLSISVTIIILCGDICKQGDSLLVWLSRQENIKIPETRLIALLNDISSHAVAVRGSIYVLNYICACNIMNVLITLSTLCIQSGVVPYEAESGSNNTSK